ncbi:MAG: DEAD/DEAH box helicase [Cenarchaeum sp. SB0678_bin_8]|nr:DEAD/DEAH box helicase [Cenarchaeum sp. SB0666_bin_15]MYD59395.1 DEAD/DEAH box helicase [Cenarchaeum sp. SB0678_bin_8]MYJ27498.1 DEAD/DEAH box helicase [Cenarchaeum sp. SB0672_bin_9]
MYKLEDSNTATARTSKVACIEKFKSWWTLEEIVEVISELSMGLDVLFQIQKGSRLEVTQDSMAEVLYDLVGPRFLRTIGNDAEARRTFLTLIIVTGINKGLFTEDGLLKAASEVAPKGSIKYMNDIINMRPIQKWCLKLAEVFGLPASVAEKEHAEEPPSIETVEPHLQLNPLYDYQYSTGRYVRNILEGKEFEGKKEKKKVKRKLIAVPTGSGKTRMITETLIDWLNDGKPSNNAQQHDSRFILWIAQSHELCEQARSTFRDVFKSMGAQGTIMRLYKFWGRENALPALDIEDLLDERGIIVASIQSLYSVSQNRPEALEILGNSVSCIIVDEAHHSIAPSYSAVLRKMGFNWDNRKKEISEKGIVLLGLTATPFRGAGDGETERLHRWYNGVHFPKISYLESSLNIRPHALIDCPSAAYTDDVVRILGSRSYDFEGFITRYSWMIHSHDNKEWTYKGQNIFHRFKKPGRYEVELTVMDNDGNVGVAVSLIDVYRRTGPQVISPKEGQKDLYGKLIQRGILCDVYHKVVVSHEAIELSNKDISDIEMYGEFQPKTLGQIGSNFDRNTLILNTIKNLQDMGRSKILFFGCSVEHSRKIAIALKAMYNANTRYVDSAMDMDSRIAAIHEFREGDVEVLCNFGVLTTGFDAPGVDCVFVGRPVKSALLYTQMVGRGMRGIRTGGTDDMLIVDIDDNFQLNHTKYAPLSASMGWRLYREYWKIWKEEEEEEEAEEPEIDVSHTCSSCGIVCDGPLQIKKVFGFECPDETLVQLCQDGSQALPQMCQACRNK